MHIGPFWVGLYSTYEAEVARATSEAEQKAKEPLEILVNNLKAQLTQANNTLNQNNAELTATLNRLTSASDTGQFLRDAATKAEQKYGKLQEDYDAAEKNWVTTRKAIIFYLSLEDSTRDAVTMRDNEYSGDWNNYLASLPEKFTVETILETPDREIEIPPLREIKKAIKYEQENKVNLGDIAKIIADDK